MGFRGISLVTGIAHATIINWREQVGKFLPHTYDPELIPKVGELDELQTFVSQKKTCVWIWTVVDHFRSGILGWVVGDRGAETFIILWQAFAPHSEGESLVGYFWVSDGNPVAPGFIPDGDRILSKTYMTRVEGLPSRTLCYSKSLDILKHSLRLLIHYLKFDDVPVPA